MAVPLGIFLLRTLNLTLSTARTLAVVRGRYTSAWILGFLDSLMFVVATVGVFQDLANLWSLLAYALGYATGSLVGMVLEARFAPGHALLRIYSQEHGPALAGALHQAGYGATELPGRGASTSLVLSYIPRRQADRVARHLASIDPECRVTAEDVLQLRGGWRT
ncbi:MAG TPA: DUF5698 domain-containing protein [Anaerolineales bacterium]|nr:DUF5698 domain-containing protein [Anaerolineales bacterium]